MTTIPAFSAKMLRAPGLLKASEREMVAAAALAVTTATRASVSSATHGTNRLSGVGRKGVKVGVGFDVKGVQNPTAIVQARGPLHLIERDTKAHPIAPRRRRGKRALGNEGRGFGPVASAQHPGTKGKHPFEEGVNAGIAPAMRAADAVLGKTMFKVVRG